MSRGAPVTIIFIAPLRVHLDQHAYQRSSILGSSGSFLLPHAQTIMGPSLAAISHDQLATHIASDLPNPLITSPRMLSINSGISSWCQLLGMHNRECESNLDLKFVKNCGPSLQSPLCCPQWNHLSRCFKVIPAKLQIAFETKFKWVTDVLRKSHTKIILDRRL